MIGFMIGEVDFEQWQALIDGVDQTQPSNQRVHGPDAADIDAVAALGDLILDVAGGQDRPLTCAKDGFVDPPLNAPLAVIPLLNYAGVHSKSLLVRVLRKALHSLKHRKRREISSFS